MWTADGAGELRPEKDGGGMLSAGERQRIDAGLKQVPDRRGACLEALRIVQRARGFVSDESLLELANYLDLSPHELDSIATFYNLIYRRPVGRHVILLCDSVSCWILGYESIRDRLRARLRIEFGETTPDGRFTLLPVSCLGACDLAPAMMIDGDLHGNLSDEKLDEILERYA